MKRTIILLLLVISLPAFALIPQSNSNFVIKGYYIDATGSSLLMTIMDTEGNRLYETNAFVSDSHTEAEEEIFNWTLVGNSNNITNVKFTFTTLQSYVNGIYYRPAYVFKMYQNASVTANNRSDSFYSSTSKTAASNSRASADYEYTSTTSVSYSGKVSNNNNNIWTRSGYCTLKINDFENSSGSYEYRCRVTVEFSAE